MNKQVIKLANTICWDRSQGDKVYLDHAQISIVQFPFATRQVFLRFVSGPELDFSILDMDRLVVEYLKMRGVKLQCEVRELTNAESPPRCDFVVPNSIMAKSVRRTDPKVPGKRGKGKRCARCRQIRARSGEWYGDLCPECADATEGDWVCQLCDRRGNFETMGGHEARNPISCASPCEQIKFDSD
jgi:hypothetical protein